MGSRLLRPEEERQGSLSPALHYAEQGCRLRKLLNKTIQINGLDIVDLQRDTGIDDKHIGRTLKDDGGAHPPLALVACVLSKDRSGTFITGLAEMLGYEAHPREPDLAEENRHLRSELADIKARLERLLTP